tara:strand:- start:297 stop:488 length:192 start_codon:yes stop_codon:yes gene_type:complete
LAKPETRKEDIAIVMVALQEQAFVLSNCIENLVKKWPKPPIAEDPPITNGDLSMFGILLDNRD